MTNLLRTSKRDCLRKGLGYHHIGHSNDQYKSSQRLQRNSRDCIGTWLFPFDIPGTETRIMLSNLSLSSEAYRYLNSLPLQSERQTGQKWTVLLDWISAPFKWQELWKKIHFWSQRKKNHGKHTKDLCTAPQCSNEVGHLNWD